VNAHGSTRASAAAPSSVDAVGKLVYPLLCVDACTRVGIHPLDHGRALLEFRPSRMQLRAKSLPARAALALLGELVPLAAAAGTVLFVNDRVDWALASGAPGVHLGDDDLAPADAHRIAPNLRIGLSTHSEADVARALQPAPHLAYVDYLAYGPIFATTSKVDHAPIVGIAELGRIQRQLAGRDLVAIGGITASTARQLCGLVTQVACIDALLQRNPAESARQLAHALALGSALA
jgi:thiamine-phosphate pyrophosphorylase